MAAKDALLELPNQILATTKRSGDAVLATAKQVAEAVDNAVPDFRPEALKDTLPARRELMDQAFELTQRVFDTSHGAATAVVALTSAQLGKIAGNGDSTNGKA